MIAGTKTGTCPVCRATCSPPPLSPTATTCGAVACMIKHRRDMQRQCRERRLARIMKKQMLGKAVAA